MGIYICRYESTHDLIRITSDAIDKLLPFEVEQTEVSLTKEDLKKLIKNSKGKEEKEIFEDMLKQLGDSEAGDFLIG